jgi:hypothetical protein
MTFVTEIWEAGEKLFCCWVPSRGGILKLALLIDDAGFDFPPNCFGVDGNRDGLTLPSLVPNVNTRDGK